MPGAPSASQAEEPLLDQGTGRNFGKFDPSAPPLSEAPSQALPEPTEVPVPREQREGETRVSITPSPERSPVQPYSVAPEQ
eukprot:589204-Karenia_brevis.AAC.1